MPNRSERRPARPAKPSSTNDETAYTYSEPVMPNPVALAASATAITEYPRKPWQTRIPARPAGSASEPPPPPPDTTAPAAPANFTIEPTNAGAELTWTDPVDADLDHLVLQRAGSVIADNITPGTQAFSDSGLTNGQSYTYELAAVDGAGNTSETVSDTVTPVAPVAWVYELAASDGVLPKASGWVNYYQNGQTTAIDGNEFVLNSSGSFYGFYSDPPDAIVDSTPITFELEGFSLPSGSGNLWMVELYNGTYSAIWRPRPDGFYRGVTTFTRVAAVDLTVPHDVRFSISPTGTGTLTVDGTVMDTYQGSANASNNIRWGQDTAGVAQLRVRAIRYIFEVL